MYKHWIKIRYVTMETKQYTTDRIYLSIVYNTTNRGKNILLYSNR